MQLALIDDLGNVINVIEASEGFDPGARVMAMPATGGVGPGWRWQDDTFHPPPNKLAPALKVSDLQFRRALTVLGLRDQAEALVANGSRDIQDYWDRSLTIERHSSLVTKAAQALGKSESEIDALFDLAATL